MTHASTRGLPRPHLRSEVRELFARRSYCLSPIETESKMLVASFKTGESVVIGDVTVTVLEIISSKGHPPEVRLGITAPRDADGSIKPSSPSDPTEERG